MNFSVLKLVSPPIQKNLLALLVAIFSFLLFFSTFQAFINSEIKGIKAQESIEIANFAETLKIKINRELNAIIFLTDGISSYFSVYHEALDDNSVNAILAELYNKSKHVRSFGLAVGYRIKNIYPIAGNLKAINLDYREVPEQWIEVQKAVATKAGVLDGPINLVQGGKGLIYRYPIFINNQYWGMVSSVIDTKSFMQAVFGSGADDKYKFAVRLIHAENQAMLYGSETLFNNKNAFITQSEVPNGKLEWAVVKLVDKEPAHILKLKVMGWVISLLFAGTLFLLVKDRQALATEASSDSLTGIANRRSITKKLEHALEYANKHQKLIVIMLLDVDNFKRINDVYGHDFGDEVLKVVSKTISNVIRDGDTLSRIGGDEFVILLNDIESIEDGSVIANKIIEIFQKPVLINNRLLQVGLSIGLATSSPDYNEVVRGLMKKADIALYEAKESGRNKYMVYNQRME